MVLCLLLTEAMLLKLCLTFFLSIDLFWVIVFSRTFTREEPGVILERDGCLDLARFATWVCVMALSTTLCPRGARFDDLRICVRF